MTYAFADEFTTNPLGRQIEVGPVGVTWNWSSYYPPQVVDGLLVESSHASSDGGLISVLDAPTALGETKRIAIGIRCDPNLGKTNWIFGGPEPVARKHTGCYLELREEATNGHLQEVQASLYTELTPTPHLSVGAYVIYDEDDKYVNGDNSISAGTFSSPSTTVEFLLEIGDGGIEVFLDGLLVHSIQHDLSGIGGIRAKTLTISFTQGTSVDYIRADEFIPTNPPPPPLFWQSHIGTVEAIKKVTP